MTFTALSGSGFFNYCELMKRSVGVGFLMSSTGSDPMTESAWFLDKHIMRKMFLFFIEELEISAYPLFVARGQDLKCAYNK